MSVPLQPRQQKISPEALARRFHEFSSTSRNESPNWDALPETEKQRLIGIFHHLQELFLDFGDPGKMRVSHIVSHLTREGVVQVQFGQASGQMPPDDARRMAYEFLDAADAAELESAIFEVLRGNESPEAEVNAVKFIEFTRDVISRRRVARYEQSTKNTQ